MNSIRLETELVLNLSFSASPIQFVRNNLPFCLHQFYVSVNWCSHQLILFYMDLSQKLGMLWVYRWEAQNIHRGKKRVLLCIEPLLDVLKPLFTCTKKFPCKTTHSSFISFYSEIISACPRAWRLLVDLNAVKKYSSCEHFRIPEKWAHWGTLNLAGLPE